MSEAVSEASAAPLARECARGGACACVHVGRAALWPAAARGRPSWAVSFQISDYLSTASGCMEIRPGLGSLTAQRAFLVNNSRPEADLSSSYCFQSRRNPARRGPETVSRESRPEHDSVT